MENKIPKEIEETTQRQVQSLDRALNKIAKMEERFDQIDKRFDEIIEQLDRIKKKQVEINKVKRWVWIVIIIFLIPIVIGILNSISGPPH
ncbi:MAG: hypothetical protein WBZ33_08145 [Thermoactinomyces sp.]